MSRVVDRRSPQLQLRNALGWMLAMRARRASLTASLMIAGVASYPLPPHSGYHMTGRRAGFEGWYHRLTLPDASFGFIASIFDPADQASSRHGVGFQLVGPDDVLSREGPADSFWADDHAFALGHTYSGVAFSRIAPPAAYARFVQEGFQMSSTRHQGRLADGSAEWCFDVTPQLGWGGREGAKQWSTAGWLASLPVFEPHYQIIMAHGVATGHVSFKGTRREFVDAPIYSEKNWGGAFPRRWWWLQCNAFDGKPGLTFTAACGERGNPLLEPLLPGRTEDACMVALHDAEGGFYPFATNQWQVRWGTWTVDGALDDLRVRVEASCPPDENAALTVACPSADGMTARARERFDGELTVKMWRVRPGTEEEAEVLLEARSSCAAVEVGGQGWEGGAEWVGSCEVEGAARALLAAEVPLERVKDSIPGY